MDMMNISVEDALTHPNWKMGNKITIDSATMMNKGLEVIEARWLFDMNIEKIKVLIHPQSIIHSMVEFIDGSVKAQSGLPDMRIPIQYSLTFPERVASDFPPVDFAKIKTLTFEEPDFGKFRCLKIAYDVSKQQGTYPVVMNAANEVAVNLFLNERIAFGMIPVIIERQLDKHNGSECAGLEQIVEIDLLTRQNVMKESA